MIYENMSILYEKHAITSLSFVRKILFTEKSKLWQWQNVSNFLLQTSLCGLFQCYCLLLMTNAFVTSISRNYISNVFLVKQLRIIKMFVVRGRWVEIIRGRGGQKH